MKNRSLVIGFCLAAVLLTIFLPAGLRHVGLAGLAAVTPLTHSIGTAQQMSLTGFSARPIIICNKISPSPTLLVAADSVIVSKKIRPPPDALNGDSASPAATAPPSDTAPPQTTFELTATADKWPLTALFLHFVDRWRVPYLSGTLEYDTGTAEPDLPASAQGDEAALSSDRPLGVAPVVNALLTGNDAEGISAAMLSANQTSGAAPATPPRPEPAPTAPSSPAATGKSDEPPSLPYSLQLSSCRALKNARQAAADFRKKGLDPYLVNVYLKSKPGSWWRVMVGQYPSLEAAQRAKESLQLTQAIVKRTRFANLIGEYQNEDALLEVKKRLEASRFSAYAVKDATSGLRLYVGAFTRQHQAEEQAVDLRANGMMCRVVLR
ncbi:MAG: SPOR domain-containing protein [Desulfobacterales bacterium]